MLSYAGAMCSFPAILFHRGLNERGYHEQLQQQHQQKQQALDPRFPVLSWACAAPGVSGVVAICRLRISVLSDPMGCKQQRKGKVRNISLFISFFVCFKTLTQKCWRPQPQRNWKAKLLIFPPWKLLGVESFRRFTHLSAVMEGKGLMNSSRVWEYNEKGVVLQRTKDTSKESWRARALGTEVYKGRSWKGCPEVLTSRPS